MRGYAGGRAGGCAERHHPAPSPALRERVEQQSDQGPPGEVDNWVSLYFLSALNLLRTRVTGKGASIVVVRT